MKTRILIIDEHPLFRSMLASFINAEPDMEVIGEAANRREGIRLARGLRPDVVILDAGFPADVGFKTTTAIRRTMPAVKVVGLSVRKEEDSISEMLAAGSEALGSLGFGDLVCGIRQLSTH